MFCLSYRGSLQKWEAVQNCGRPTLNQSGSKPRQFCRPSCRTAYSVAHKSIDDDKRTRASPFRTATSPKRSMPSQQTAAIPPFVFGSQKSSSNIATPAHSSFREGGGARYPMRSTQLSWSSAGRKSRFTDSMIHAPTKIRGNNARTNRKPESSSHPP